MRSSPRILLSIACLVSLVMFSCLVTAAEPKIERAVYPQSQGSSDEVTVTITLPVSFFGGIIEEVPEGFTFTGTAHPLDGVKQDGQTIIFAVTGEDEIQYTIRMPETGCGYLNGYWEDVEAKTSGTIPATLLSTPGADLSSCTGKARSPGFGGLQAILSISAAALCIILLRWRG